MTSLICEFLYLLIVMIPLIFGPFQSWKLDSSYLNHYRETSIRWLMLSLVVLLVLVLALKVIQGDDVLKTELPRFDICVANIPYQISSPLTFKLLFHPNKLQMRCDHVPEGIRHETRCPARKISTAVYLVNTQLYARVSHLLKVSKNNFRPPPKVDSSVFRIEPRKPGPQVNKKEWYGFLGLCFIRKNKTLGSIFKQKSVLSMLEKTLQAVLASLQNNGSNGEASALNTAMDLGYQSMGIEDDDKEMDDDDDMEKETEEKHQSSRRE